MVVDDEEPNGNQNSHQKHPEVDGCQSSKRPKEWNVPNQGSCDRRDEIGEDCGNHHFQKADHHRRIQMEHRMEVEEVHHNSNKECWNWKQDYLKETIKKLTVVHLD